MAFYEKALGYVVIPFLFVLLLLLATGILRRQIHSLILLLLKFKFNLNGRTIYFFPFLAMINLVGIFYLYHELIEMHEPEEISART